MCQTRRTHTEDEARIWDVLKKNAAEARNVNTRHATPARAHRLSDQPASAGDSLGVLPPSVHYEGRGEARYGQDGQGKSKR